jgi:CheY-like chemotaxis protein
MSQRIPILVVDDDPDFLELIEFNLKLSGFEVTLATSGPEALEIAKEQPRPSVILLDTTMPEMNGLEVLSELKYTKATENIPVFMLTAKTMIGDIEQAFEIGADDYITKPVEMSKLGKLVKDKLAKMSSV